MAQKSVMRALEWSGALVFPPILTGTLSDPFLTSPDDALVGRLREQTKTNTDSTGVSGGLNTETSARNCGNT